MEEAVTERKSSVISTAAFAEFYDRSAPEVYRYLARCVLGDRALAEDLTQETFAAVVVAARTGRDEALTMPWVMGVARHKMIDHYRRAARDERHLALVLADGSQREQVELLDGNDPEQALELMRSLSSEHRLVLILKYIDGLPAQEIASKLDRSLHATNSLLGRARRALASSITGSQA